MKKMAKNKTKSQKPGKTKSHSKKVCIECPSYCCHDMSMMITKPRNRAEIREYKWYLHYDTVNIAIRSNKWYLVVKGRCIYLDENNMCAIYDRRPFRCRQHIPPDCEKFATWYETLFETPEQLEQYWKNPTSTNRTKEEIRQD